MADDQQLEQLRKEAEQAWTNKQPKKLLTLYARIQKFAALTAEEYVRWGEVASSNKDNETACEKFERATQIAPNNAIAHAKLGHIYFRQARLGETHSQREKYEQAIKSYDAAIRLATDETWKADLHNSAGNALFNQGKSEKAKYEEAVIRYEAAIALKPKEPLYYINCGDAFLALEQFKKAIEKYREAAKHRSDDASELKELGKAFNAWGNHLYAQQKLEKALQKYRKAIEQESNSIDYHNNLARTLNEAGKCEESISHFNTVQKNESLDLNDESYSLWASALYLLDDYEQATEKYEQAHQLNPKDPIWSGNLGNTLYRRQQYEAALKYYRQSIANYERLVETIPQDQADSLIFPYAYTWRGALLYELCNYPAAWDAWDDAIGAYRKASEDKRVVRDSMFFYGYALIQKEVFNNAEKAREISLRALKKNPDDILTLTLLVELHLQSRDRIANQYERYAQTEPMALSWHSYRSRSDIRRLEKSHRQAPYGLDHSKARGWYNTAKKLLSDQQDELTPPKQVGWKADAPRYAEILAQLGELALAMDEIKQARDYLSEALDINKDSSELHAQLGVAYTRKTQTVEEDYHEAAEHFLASLRIEPNNLNVWSNLAETYFKQKKLHEAEAEYRRILLISPNHVESLIGLGEAYVAMGEEGEADFFERAIQNFNSAINLATNKRRGGSKWLTKKEHIEVLYLRGYAKIKLYEDDNFFKKEHWVKSAAADFKRCLSLDPSYYRARRARAKILQGRGIYRPNWFVGVVGPILIGSASFAILLLSTTSFFFNWPTHAIAGRPSTDVSLLASAEEEGSAAETPNLEADAPLVGGAAQFSGLAFGSLVFMVIALYLPQILKLKVAGIELEKSSVDQIQTSRTLGIRRQN